MRIVTVEEHFALPSLAKRVSPEASAARGFVKLDPSDMSYSTGPELDDLGAGRIAAMDAHGITVQVLSYQGPGADLVDPAESPAFAREVNDTLAQAVAGHPGRFAGFAHLPLRAPDATADELERAVKDLGFVGAMVNGSTDGRFLDDPVYEPLLARAEALGVPIYLHPYLPPKPVREGYYANLPAAFSYLLSAPGWGWHVDAGVHVLRLVASGALDRHPRLQLITGHMGECLPAMMARFDQLMGRAAEARLQRPISQTIREQLHVSTSGFVTEPPFRLLLDTFGVDRILFSADYPLLPIGPSRAFLDALPVSDADREKIAHGNADVLLGLTAG